MKLIDYYEVLPVNMDKSLSFKDNMRIHRSISFFQLHDMYSKDSMNNTENKNECLFDNIEENNLYVVPLGISQIYKEHGNMKMYKRIYKEYKRISKEKNESI